ncbi:MAG: hypothetical protein HYY62_00820, partial [Deltaproteobacteria bacterium]|nr:hypothetical protein [Deltaproteobacteria bacterium]
MKKIMLVLLLSLIVFPLYAQNTPLYTGKKGQFIFKIDRWTKIPPKLWENISPGIANPEVNLPPAIEKILSNKKNYLIPEWKETPEMIHHIYIISDVSEEARKSIPMLKYDGFMGVMRKKVGKNKFAYDFYLGPMEEYTDPQEVVDDLQEMQREVLEEEQEETEEAVTSMVTQHEAAQKNIAQIPIETQNTNACNVAPITTQDQAPVIRNTRDLEDALWILSSSSSEEQKLDAIKTLKRKLETDSLSEADVSRIVTALTSALKDPSANVRQDAFITFFYNDHIPLPQVA